MQDTLKQLEEAIKKGKKLLNKVERPLKIANFKVQQVAQIAKLSGAVAKDELKLKAWEFASKLAIKFHAEV